MKAHVEGENEEIDKMKRAVHQYERAIQVQSHAVAYLEGEVERLGNMVREGMQWGRSLESKECRDRDRQGSSDSEMPEAEDDAKGKRGSTGGGGRCRGLSNRWKTWSARSHHESSESKAFRSNELQQ